jgi:hypothetical protein
MVFYGFNPGRKTEKPMRYLLPEISSLVYITLSLFTSQDK